MHLLQGSLLTVWIIMSTLFTHSLSLSQLGVLLIFLKQLLMSVTLNNDHL